MGEMMFKTFCEGYKIYTRYLRTIAILKLAIDINLSETSLNDFAMNIVEKAILWQEFKKDHKNMARILEWVIW
jgi:hypothetical protein